MLHLGIGQVAGSAHRRMVRCLDLARRRGQPLVEQIVLTEPIEDTVPVVLAPAALGGTRHLSAAQFVHDQRDALALVASQDGHVTVFAWSTDESMVHAHRIETLLM